MSGSRTAITCCGSLRHADAPRLIRARWPPPQKAVELDDSSAEAHASLAFVLAIGSGTLPEPSESSGAPFNSIQITAPPITGTPIPGADRALHEAMNEINRAEQIDPGSNAVLADKALILFYLGRVDEAIVLAKKVEASQPSFLSTHRYLSYFDLAKAITGLRSRS